MGLIDRIIQSELEKNKDNNLSKKEISKKVYKRLVKILNKKLKEKNLEEIEETPKKIEKNELKIKNDPYDQIGFVVLDYSELDKTPSDLAIYPFRNIHNIDTRSSSKQVWDVNGINEIPVYIISARKVGKIIYDYYKNQAIFERDFNDAEIENIPKKVKIEQPELKIYENTNQLRKELEVINMPTKLKRYIKENKEDENCYKVLSNKEYDVWNYRGNLYYILKNNLVKNIAYIKNN